MSNKSPLRPSAMYLTDIKFLLYSWFIQPCVNFLPTIRSTSDTPKPR
nr:MAG TPA: hypothetical protein [Caudoviricetes sp.]